MLRIGVDIGGTFTDFAVWRNEADGYIAIESFKLPTTRPDFAGAVIAGISDIAGRNGLRTAEPIIVVHGTTVSTNAVIERSEPPVGLLVTEGYRDILTLARLRLDRSVDLFNSRATPLVPREHVFEIRERLMSDGSVDRALDAASVTAALDAARAKGISSLAVCFLHSWRNPMHERQAVEIARAHAPEIDIMASHEIWPQQSEYERAVLAVLNMYVKPLMEGYLARIESFLHERYPAARLYITKSNGGIMSAKEAQRLPIHTLLSGPAAGVTAATTLGRFLDLDRVLTFDMGGTSTDVSLIDKGRALTTGQAQVGDFPLLMPVTAIEAMGAGGGSVAWLDQGVLKVGPRSAGSQPGPACYGQGGAEPTLTDAYLIANLLSGRGLLGGRLRLDRSLAEKAFKPISATLGTGAVEAADAAIAVATSTMLAKILPFLARMGVGPADLNLMIFGGAGGIHGPIMAEDIGIRRIVVPRLPSVFCAFGGLVSDLVHDAVRSVHGTTPSADTFTSAFAEMGADGSAWLKRQSHAGQVRAVHRRRVAEMRYAAQSFTIGVDMADLPDPLDDLRLLESAFHAEHERLFGHANRSAPVAIDNLRLQTVGVQPKPSAQPRTTTPRGEPQPIERRNLRLGGRWVEQAPIFAWGDLPTGWTCAGPAIIEQDLATILVPPRYETRVGNFGDLELLRM